MNPLGGTRCNTVAQCKARPSLPSGHLLLLHYIFSIQRMPLDLWAERCIACYGHMLAAWGPAMLFPAALLMLGSATAMPRKAHDSSPGHMLCCHSSTAGPNIRRSRQRGSCCCIRCCTWHQIFSLGGVACRPSPRAVPSTESSAEQQHQSCVLSSSGCGEAGSSSGESPSLSN
jgi:hypothetical protein